MSGLTGQLQFSRSCAAFKSARNIVFSAFNVPETHVQFLIDKSVDAIWRFLMNASLRGRPTEPSAHPPMNQAGMVFARLTIVMVFAPRVSATYSSFGDMDSASRMIAWWYSKPLTSNVVPMSLL